MRRGRGGLTAIHTVVSIGIMTTRRVTANLPEELLETAMTVTGKGITETLVEGLEQVQRRRFFERAMSLGGKLKLEVDVEKARGRRRH